MGQTAIAEPVAESTPAPDTSDVVSKSGFEAHAPNVEERADKASATSFELQSTTKSPAVGAVVKTSKPVALQQSIAKQAEPVPQAATPAFVLPSQATSNFTASPTSQPARFEVVGDRAVKVAQVAPLPPLPGAANPSSNHGGPAGTNPYGVPQNGGNAAGQSYASFPATPNAVAGNYGNNPPLAPVIQSGTNPYGYPANTAQGVPSGYGVAQPYGQGMYPAPAPNPYAYPAMPPGGAPMAAPYGYAAPGYGQPMYQAPPPNPYAYPAMPPGSMPAAPYGYAVPGYGQPMYQAPAPNPYAYPVMAPGSMPAAPYGYAAPGYGQPMYQAPPPNPYAYPAMPPGSMPAAPYGYAAPGYGQPMYPVPSGQTAAMPGAPNPYGYPVAPGSVPYGVPAPGYGVPGYGTQMVQGAPLPPMPGMQPNQMGYPTGVATGIGSDVRTPYAVPAPNYGQDCVMNVCYGATPGLTVPSAPPSGRTGQALPPPPVEAPNFYPGGNSGLPMQPGYPVAQPVGQVQPTQPTQATPPIEQRPSTRSAPLNSPSLRLQGVAIYQGDEFSARARVAGIYPLTPNLLAGATLDFTEGNAFSDSPDDGLNINELYLAASIPSLPNLRFAVGQLDLTSYFDRNSFAKDGATHFFNTAFQTNPALAATAIGSRPAALVNWSITDNIEAKAAVFSSSRSISDFSLDGFAAEVGFRYGNFIVRGTYASARDAGADTGFQEIFQVDRGIKARRSRRFIWSQC